MSRAVGSSLWRAIRLDTLRGRLSILLIVVTITPIVLIGFTSYYWMYKGQSEKIVANYQSMVDGQRAAIEKAAATLGSVSQLLVVDGGLGDDIIAYLTAADPVEKTELFRGIDKSLINIAYSNLIVNGLFFFMPDYPSAYQFESAPIKPDLPDTVLRPRPEDVLYRANQLMFLGPHPSALAGHDEPVLSLTRLVEYGAGRSYYMYLEAEFGELLRPSGTEAKGAPLNVLTQADGTVMYSDLPEGGRGRTASGSAKRRLERVQAFRVGRRRRLEAVFARWARRLPPGAAPVAAPIFARSRLVHSGDHFGRFLYMAHGVSSDSAHEPRDQALQSRSVGKNRDRNEAAGVRYAVRELPVDAGADHRSDLGGRAQGEAQERARSREADEPDQSAFSAQLAQYDPMACQGERPGRDLQSRQGVHARAAL
ncbi:hypothetical protein [Cohnella rhizosphaerae]|uniref:Uncharacterized protein n=1 Tax=Cohnella rhizosphaerae TaxID=1457232 RepID=A0A9X4KZV8_9BACL|nr:hypothetical protein [Cohnella rhizosphaerae]MDG0814354.1 hypothetical protein [Cohnella rhizosphaerae]